MIGKGRGGLDKRLLKASLRWSNCDSVFRERLPSEMDGFQSSLDEHSWAQEEESNRGSAVKQGPDQSQHGQSPEVAQLCLRGDGG
jgi:hypothetical protein